MANDANHRDTNPRSVSRTIAGVVGFGLIGGLVSYIRKHLHAEERLIESEDKFRSLADDSLVGIYIIQESYFRYVNPKMAEIFGYEVAEIVDRIPPRLLVVPEDWPLVRDNLQKRLTGEERSIHYEFRGLRKNNDVLFIEVFGSRTVIGGKPAVIGTLLDITERKNSEIALRASERKFRAIFDQTFQFTGLLARDGTLLEANRAALAFVGAETVDVVGKPFWETRWWSHSIEEQEKLRMAVARAAHGQFVRLETTHRAADGTLHHFDFSLNPVTDETGNVTLLIPEGRDITERKELERLKDEMISAVSHEMRTPLTAMMGYTELLLEDEQLSAGQKAYVQVVHDKAEQLSELIEDFLDLQMLVSRRKPPSFVAVAILPLLEAVAAAYAGISPRHRFTVNCPVDLPPVRGNPEQLSKVLDNLVSNAVKFSPDGGEVILGARQEKDGVVILVQDEGIGIPEQEVGKIFDTLYRVDHGSGRIFPGTGLGLALVREIILIHGGSIWVESRVGRGSTFHIRLGTLSDYGETP